MIIWIKKCVIILWINKFQAPLLRIYCNLIAARSMVIYWGSEGGSEMNILDLLISKSLSTEIIG
jgi:hypothetical protein